MPSKPDMTYAWAESSILIADPGTVKTQEGWVVEKPLVEYMNWLQNRSDTFIQHVNENGIPVWDTNTPYTLGALAKGSDDVIYKSKIAANQGNDPISDAINWEKLGGGVEIIKEGILAKPIPASSPVYTTAKGIIQAAPFIYYAADINTNITNVTDITDPAGTGGWTTLLSYTGSGYRLTSVLANGRLINFQNDPIDSGKSFRLQATIDGEIVFDTYVTFDATNSETWGWGLPYATAAGTAFSFPLFAKSDFVLKAARSGGAFGGTFQRLIFNGLLVEKVEF